MRLPTFVRPLRHRNAWRLLGNFPKMPGRLEENQLLSQDFLDILSAFSEESVEYMVVGGYAMAFHGHVRATGDIDLWVRIAEENVDRIWRALRIFGAPMFDLVRDDLLSPGMVFQMGVVPNRIDIINRIDGVDFDEAWKEHKLVEIAGITVPVIGKNDLLLNKKAAGRPKDLNDVLWMESE
jgi:hypothetical protein